MTTGKFIILVFQKFSKRKPHGTTYRSSNWRDLMKKELESCNSKIPEENDPLCIYKVPSNMLQVEPEAYTPKNISIGPYHHGAPHLQNMELLKRKFYHRLFHPNNGANGAKLDEAFKFLEEQESNIRRCYMDNIKLSSDEFLQMMLVDCSFIIQLLRDLSSNEFKLVPSFSGSMLPTIRRELIMLENQVPLFVLNKLFELTRTNTFGQPSESLNDLAYRFLYRLVQSDSHKTPECEKYRYEMHMLDLLRYSIGPKLIETGEKRGTQKQMIRSATELMESGVKIKGDKNREMLNIKFGKKYGIIGVNELTIPRLHISDRRGTVFRNIVAFEKCHERCCSDFTTYLFFFNRLIKSADDVALLHRKEVLDHSLGSDERVADLINDIVKEIVPDLNESYLHKVVNDANKYYGTCYARARASIVRHYWTVGITTTCAVLGVCFTFVQLVDGSGDWLKSIISS